MLLISKIEMSVINKMADAFLVNYITGKPWYLAKLTPSLIQSVHHELIHGVHKS